MARRLYRQERLNAIVRQMHEAGYVSVSELADLFDVSAVTIRADLELLERTGKLIRMHGGALPMQQADGSLSFANRQRMRVQAKERIGAAAAELVSDGEAIVLDASSTAWHMARCLLSRRELTVLTTGLYVALELLRVPGITVMVPGGPIWREAAAVVGTDGLATLNAGHLEKGFFGGRGLTVAEGLTDANRGEVLLKSHLVRKVREANAIVDSSKLGKVAFASCASIDDLRRVITDREAQPDQVVAIRDRGIEVVLA